MKSSLGTLLDSGESGLFLLEGLGDSDTEMVALQARARGYQFLNLDCRAVGDKAALMQAARQAFELPAYFGENWDALTDCLMDLSWLSGLRWVLLASGLQRLWAQDPESYHTTLEILREVCAFWEEQERPFMVLLREDCGPEAASSPPVAFA
jgi:RNAse (barnase) inhibitor barstar